MCVQTMYGVLTDLIITTVRITHALMDSSSVRTENVLTNCSGATIIEIVLTDLMKIAKTLYVLKANSGAKADTALRMKNAVMVKEP